MSTATRDDFSRATMDRLAGRAGYLCSFPGCRQLTIGPSDDRRSGLTMVGVCAHITAAAQGGPRFDAALTSDERTSESNGIWLCQLHGKHVDDNASRYMAGDLRRWKSQHGEWVSARLASADSGLKHGITSIAMENVGPFREPIRVPLGQHNVVSGRNGAGKTTLCQSIAAFAGGGHFENFRRRWRLFGPSSPSMSIEVAVSVLGVRTTVRLSEQPLALKRPLKDRQSRLHAEINGNISVRWPQALFNIVHLESPELKRNQVKSPFRRHLRAIAWQLGMNEDLVWDALREELFCSATFGSRIRRSGRYRAEVRPLHGTSFYDTSALSGVDPS